MGCHKVGCKLSANFQPSDLCRLSCFKWLIFGSLAKKNRAKDILLCQLDDWFCVFFTLLEHFLLHLRNICEEMPGCCLKHKHSIFGKILILFRSNLWYSKFGVISYLHNAHGDVIFKNSQTCCEWNRTFCIVMLQSNCCVFFMWSDETWTSIAFLRIYWRSFKHDASKRHSRILIALHKKFWLFEIDRIFTHHDLNELLLHFWRVSKLFVKNNTILSLFQCKIFKNEWFDHLLWLPFDKIDNSAFLLKLGLQ